MTASALALEASQPGTTDTAPTPSAGPVTSRPRLHARVGPGSSPALLEGSEPHGGATGDLGIAAFQWDSPRPPRDMVDLALELLKCGS